VTPEQKVVQKFTARIAATVGFHRELLMAVHLKKHQASLESIIVEQFVLSTAVQWEVLVSDLLLTYLVKGPKPYLTSLKKRVSQSIKERYGADIARTASLTLPTSLTVARAKAFVDPKGFNISATDSAGLAKRANELLEAQYAKRFTLAADDSQLVDFVIAMRNYLGHRSKSSRASLRQAISVLSGPNSDLNGQFVDSGTFLKHRVGADPRSIICGHTVRAGSQDTGVACRVVRRAFLNRTA
jgi:hypothetical protein